MLASVLLAAALAQAPAANATPAPAPAANPAVDARAREWFERLQSGNIDYRQLDAQGAQALNSDVVLIISTDWSALGKPLSFQNVRVDAPTATTPDTTYVYHMLFANDVGLEFYFSLDQQGLISGMLLGPEE